ncbi:helix-turn-helix domain-containing protein [Cellulomonas sp. A375-1]|uniref:helix-turn-helix domain-containing protein n=1 Tax=Cellulomonas sp. A375-1 TaxID=1672219 RepID=UPI0012E1D69E|nr:helix-turn-helix domain-containing protein [Cellulomonas sp. A375-1]
MTQHLTVTDLAERWKRPAKWVRDQAAASAIPAVKLGGTWRFPLDEIEAHERRQHNAYRDPMSIAPRAAARRQGRSRR